MEELKISEKMAFRLAEELKFRRKACSEYDEKVKTLLNDLNKAERLLEEEKTKYKNLSLEHERHIMELKKMAQDKFVEFNVRSQTVASKLELSENEMKLTREEVQALKLKEYDLERKCQDFERKLQLADSNGKMQSDAIANFQERCQKLQASVKQLFEMLRWVSNAVDQTKKTNAKMELLYQDKVNQFDVIVEREQATRNELVNVKAELKRLNFQPKC